jgi:putative zinc finger/helix-turn-helix YgiT family protein
VPRCYERIFARSEPNNSAQSQVDKNGTECLEPKLLFVLLNTLRHHQTRKKLKLDQREAAEIFGGGPNAFSRYENGKTRTPLALVQLFKLSNNHPELIGELTTKQSKDNRLTARSRLARRKSALV